MPSGGSIVINGSIVSIKGIPAFGVYAATKAALRSSARTWAVDSKARNIRVNVVAPGTIVTPGYKSELGLSEEQIAGFKAEAAAATPLARTGMPEEVAAVPARNRKGSHAPVSLLIQSRRRAPVERPISDHLSTINSANNNRPRLSYNLIPQKVKFR